MYKLMIVDDESKTRQTLYRHVPWREMGITEIEEAEDGSQALLKSETFSPDIVLTDVRMPRMNGIEFAKELRTARPYCKVIFLSAYTDVEYLKTAIRIHAFDYVEKPLDLEEIERVVKSAIAECEQEQPKRQAKPKPDPASVDKMDGKPVSSIVARTANLIREQAGNQNLTIGYIAGQLYLTPSYICLLFKNETGMTVNQYLTSVRMDMAKSLIPRLKVHEVARQVGYADTKYFTKVFKKEVGETPSEYKERLRP